LKKEIVLLLLVIVLSPVAISAFSFRVEGEETPEGGTTIELSGYLNVRELLYLDGASSYEFILTVDDVTSSVSSQYLLEIDGKILEELGTHTHSLAGSYVTVSGRFEDDGKAANQQSGETQSAYSETRMIVATMDLQSEHEENENIVTSSTFAQRGRESSVRTLNQIVVPVRYSDVNTTPHSEKYYVGQFYEQEKYSLAAYWRDASYGQLSLNGNVAHWVDLPRTEEYYLNFGGRERDLIQAVDSQIDFDGADNEIQNSSPANVQRQKDRDDVDSVIGIYNGLLGFDIAGYSYLAPIRLATEEGTIYSYFTAIKDTGYGSPVGVPSNYFVGLAAHEMGHNLGWFHTATSNCVYCDPWSLMSGGIYSEFGPSGPIAAHRDREGWIHPEDILIVADKIGQEDSVVEFTLDMLSNPNGQNYLMAKIPFGSHGEYYTIEARKNAINDHTPLEKTGIVMYHHNPRGHVESMEPRSFEMIVDTTGIGDFANADIDVGRSFADKKHKITITNIAETVDAIDVRVTRGAMPPGSSEVECNGLHATIVGTPGDDILTGTSDNDVINGMGGKDTMFGLEGNDTICGGHNSDIIEGGPGDDFLFGNFGNDDLSGGAGNDDMIGGRGEDDLDGGDGDDTLSGWSGDDELSGGDGNDSLYGGDGDDFLLGGNGNDKLRGWIGDDIYADKSDHET
jgi:M6 family metalloprotease-like protein